MVVLLPRPSLLPDPKQQGPFLVTAPAGFGKTSLLRLWAAPREARWLTLTPEHNDPTFFLAALEAAQGSAAALVLDDFHVIESEDVRARVELLCEQPGLQLAIGSRRDPELAALGRHRVRRTLAECRAEALAFRGAELEALLEAMGLSLDLALRPQLERTTGGWAGAVVLIGEWLAPLPPHQQALALQSVTTTHTALYDYLAHEVVASLPEELGRLLEEACLLAYLDTHSHPQETLQALERRRLLTRTPEGHWGLHPLLQEHLQARLSPPKRTALCRRWAERLTDLRAFPLWAELGEETRLAEAVVDYARASTSWWVLRPWVLKVPPTLRDAQPYLWRILSRLEVNAGRVAPAEEALVRAERAFGQRADSEALVLCQLDRGVLLRGQGRWSEVVEVLDAVAQGLETLSPRLQLRYWADRAVALWEAQRDRAAAGAAFDRAQQLAEEQGNRAYQALLLINRAFALELSQGAFHRVFAAAEALEALYQGAIPTDDRMFAAQLRAQAGFALGDPRTPMWLEQARQAALDAGYPTAPEEAWQALWCAEHGAVAAAMTALEHTGDDPRALRAACYLNPEPEKIEAALRADASAESHNDLAEALRRAGQAKTAWDLMVEAKQQAEAQNLPIEIFRAQVAQALLRPTREALHSVLRAAQDPTKRACLLQRYRRFLPTLLQQALRRGGEREAVWALLREAQIPAVQIQLFGELQVSFDGNTPLVWPRPKTKALFAYLLLSEQGVVHTEQVLEALWPELEREKARPNFHVHCSNLRRVMGAEHLEMTHSTLQLRLPAVQVRDDLALKEALTVFDPETAQELLAALGEAPFLVEFLYEDWSAAARYRFEEAREALKARLGFV